MNSNTFLHAIHTGRFYMVLNMLEQGMDPNTRQQSNGNTALINACLNAYPEIVNLLLVCGADPYLKNNMGEDAFSTVEEFRINKFCRPDKLKKINDIIFNIENIKSALLYYEDNPELFIINTLIRFMKITGDSSKPFFEKLYKEYVIQLLTEFMDIFNVHLELAIQIFEYNYGPIIVNINYF